MLQGATFPEAAIRPAILLLPASVLLLNVGCASKIDRFTLDRVIPTAAKVGDTGEVCALGTALVHPLGSVSHNPPDRALTIADGVAAVCDQSVAWEAELDAARVKHNGAALGEGRTADTVDAQLAARRAHARTAARFERSFDHLEAEYGTVGAAECPKIAEKDEFAYLFGLVAGTLALLHDSASGGVNEVPRDRLAAIARGAGCLDDAAWWQVPSALSGAAWATVPGTGPAGNDPWKQMEDAATAGETSGVRVARAIQVLIAANAGRTDVLESALAKHAASLAATPTNPDWALLDTYATEVSLHQSDLLWTEARGHRTETFGQLPGDEAPPAEPGPDPFAGDDPFGAPAPEAPAPTP